MAITAKTDIIFLNLKERDRKVMVVWENEDRFMTTVEDAARACHQASQNKVFQEQFSRLIDHLAAWVRQYQERFAHAFLTMRDYGLLFVVVQRDTPMDVVLNERLLDLDLEVSQDPEFDLVCFDTMPLPRASVEGMWAFLNPNYLLEFRDAD